MEWISASPKNMGSNKPGAQIISLNEMEWNGMNWNEMEWNGMDKCKSKKYGE